MERFVTVEPLAIYTNYIDSIIKNGRTATIFKTLKALARVC
jgi:hypothetical protein